VDGGADRGMIATYESHPGGLKDYKIITQLQLSFQGAKV